MTTATTILCGKCEKNLCAQIEDDDSAPPKFKKVVLTACCDKLAHLSCLNKDIYWQRVRKYLEWRTDMQKNKGWPVKHVEWSTFLNEVNQDPPPIAFVECAMCHQKARPLRRVRRFPEVIDNEEDHYIGQLIPLTKLGDCRECITHLESLNRTSRNYTDNLKRQVTVGNRKAKQLQNLKLQMENRLQAKNQQIATLQQEANQARQERDHFIKRTRFAEDAFDTILEIQKYGRIFNRENHPMYKFLQPQPVNNNEHEEVPTIED